jgi:hypothetical protein
VLFRSGEGIDAFDIASELEWRGIGCPPAWHYRPGLSGPCRPDCDEIRAASGPDLVRAGMALVGAL